jgi:hypothetical protein
MALVAPGGESFAMTGGVSGKPAFIGEFESQEVAAMQTETNSHTRRLITSYVPSAMSYQMQKYKPRFLRPLPCMGRSAGH